jgi:cation transport ATPase
MNNKKLVFPIRGMHCKSCEILIEGELKDVQGVAKAEANYKRSEVVIICEENQEPSRSKIIEAVGAAGYIVGDPEKTDSVISKNKKDYKELAIAFLIIAGLYLVFRDLGLGNVNFISGQGIPIALVVGLVAGVSTCMALVGGLVLGVSAKHAEMHPEATTGQKFRPHLFFNLGRFLSYAFLGGLLGMLGSIFQFSSLTLGIITIAVGVLMFIMGL